VTFASFAESLARAIKRKNQSKSSGKNSNSMVANKEDTREELAMMMETDHEGTLLDENSS
jgi:hypothetical protein